MVSPSLLILAAGAGSRYGGPKQLTPIGPCGETLLEYSVYDAIGAGFSRVVLIVRPADEPLFRRRLDDGMGRRIPIVYVHQRMDDLPAGWSPPPSRTRPWGTGHAVLVAEAEIQGPFAVLNADDYYGKGSFVELARFFGEPRQGKRLALAVVAYEVAKTLSDAGPVSRAVCRTDAGRLREIVEIKKVWRHEGTILGGDEEGRAILLQEDELVSMNLWGLPRDLFSELHTRFGSFLDRAHGTGDSEFLLPEVIQALLREGRVAVRVLSGGGQWCGLTYREDRSRVSKLIADLVSGGEYPENLWE